MPEEVEVLVWSKNSKIFKIEARSRLSHAEIPLANSQLAARICGVLNL